MPRIELDEQSRPLLSICIATYNRRELILKLVRDLLAVDGSFEVCVQVDGSNDGTMEALSRLTDARLRVKAAPNQGKGGALLEAFRAAKGKFLMPFDDDDLLYADGLRTILDDCAGPIPTGAVGFIYHLESQDGCRVGSLFPVPISNFLALRADHAVTGDKKEVVLSDALHAIAYDSRGRYKRVSSSLYWSRLARDFDVVCRNVIVGQKNYLADGITANIGAIKRRDAYPMALIYRAHIAGFIAGRYRSLRFLCKALAGFVYYGARAALTRHSA